MNLVDKLLSIDSKKANELKTAEMLSKRLGELTGAQNGEKITIREIPAKRMNDLIAKQFNSKGVFDPSRNFDAKALTVAEGVVDPDLRDKALQEHFGCATSKDLAAKLFGNEVTRIADRIAELGGIGEVDETDEEIKN